MDAEDQPNPENVPHVPSHHSQDLRHTALSARVPEKVNRGVFASGTMILQTSEEFLIDFLSTIAPPQQVAARVVMTPNTFAQMIAALQENIGRYQQHFGRLVLREPSPVGGSRPVEHVPAAAPPPGGQTATAPDDRPGPKPADAPPAPPRIEDFYDQLKLSDEVLGGVFANVVMIRHTPEEFCFDFIANFFPRSVVTCRVFISAGRVPSFLEAMCSALSRYQQHGRQGPQGM
jgi:hypothetical protein